MLEDGNAGLLVPVDDPKAMADAIKSISSDTALRTRLTYHAREKLQTTYTAENQRKQFLEGLNKITTPKNKETVNFVGKKLAVDYEVLTNRKASFFRVWLRTWTDPGFRAVCLYRIGYWCRKHKMKIMSALLQRIMRITCDCNICLTAEIGPGFTIRHTGDVVVGGKVKIGSYCDIRQGVTFGGSIWKNRNGQEHPIVGDHVEVGAGAKILGPVIIGDHVIVGANAVVVSDVPSETVVGGVPARIIRKDGKLISLMEQDSSLGKILRKFDERLTKIEQKLGIDKGTEE